jgi:AraC family transcriptional regulator, regulatory protein of adaptative response / methylated-DNA-[protein]-cysteine methyltransferase
MPALSPRDCSGEPAWNGTATTVARAMRLIEERFLNEASVTEFADRLGVGPRHLLRLFIRHTGATPMQVAATRRVQQAKRLLDETQLPMSEIAFAAGFRSVRRFNDAFRATYGRSPTSFRAIQGYRDEIPGSLISTQKSTLQGMRN